VGDRWLGKLIPKSPADYCGLLSLLCASPILTLEFASGSLHFPDWMLPAVIWSIFLSPIAGLILALIAAMKSRWWLLLAAAWLAMLSFGWWYQSHHPFDL